MIAEQEKIEFSQRLNLAILHSLKRALTAPDLAIQFNLRHKQEPVTSQAAYKWLSGKAKPTNDKIDTLAQWLNVSSHWLKFGAPPEGDIKLFSGVHTSTPTGKTSSNLKGNEKELLALFNLLNERQQTLVSTLLKELAS
jgi:transcriptional regulator with XRE-family HTH domain